MRPHRCGMRPVCVSVFVLSLSAPHAARPQGEPLGSEFRINTYTTGCQFIPDVAADAGGNFVVVWQGSSPGPNGIFGQRFAASGAPLGPEFRVNSSTTGIQWSPSVASDSAGNFVVAWASGVYLAHDILGQRFASDGTPFGPEFRINTYTTSDQFSPALAADPAGNFVVVWTSKGQEVASYGLGVFGQRFASSGVPLGPEFRVNTSTTDYQYDPTVASDSTGRFVVAWSSGHVYTPPMPSDVFGQRYASNGTPLGTEFRINSYTMAQQREAAVAAAPDGEVVVLWSGEQGSGGVFGQRFAASGDPLGKEFRANTSSGAFAGFEPAVATEDEGNFIVAWSDYAVGGDIFGQRFASDGTPEGMEFRVNTFQRSQQVDAAVATDPTGNFIVVWDSYGEDGSCTGVSGQRYGRIVSVELTRFRVE